ncbi:YlbD family protein [Bacillus sp. CGMCC 1.16541]|uniref:YlbD family protein n=1 Tax=Bacillus sp. CGMCC 1.16541 TaxID=2185143 RepID=UPI000D733B9B|nr:YlbD family protein [Bacillus sp. CGMCC 1.16541]
MTETKRDLHPSVAEFKEFVKQHPKLIEEVRGQKKTWKQLYEDWYLFGANDEMWAPYQTNKVEASETETSEGEKKDFLTTLLTSLKNVDMNQMQHHITNVNSAISNIQQVLQQFQSNKPSGGGGSAGPNNPFGFRKD